MSGKSAPASSNQRLESHRRRGERCVHQVMRSPCRERPLEPAKTSPSRASSHEADWERICLEGRASLTAKLQGGRMQGHSKRRSRTRVSIQAQGTCIWASTMGTSPRPPTSSHSTHSVHGGWGRLNCQVRRAQEPLDEALEKEGRRGTLLICTEFIQSRPWNCSSTKGLVYPVLRRPEVSPTDFRSERLTPGPWLLVRRVT